MKKNIKTPLLIIAALAFIGSAVQMQRLHQADQLWGYLPLVLLLAAWVLGVGLMENRFSKSTSNKRWLGLSTLSGLLLWLGFPCMPLTPLLFVAFIPLLIIEKEIAAEITTKSTRTLVKYTYTTFVLWNILSTYWVSNSALAAGLVAILVNSFLMCIPFIIFHKTRKNLNEKLALFGLIAYWISFEKLHQWWELSWTWLTLGNAFAQYPSWVQWYEYTGVFGGSLWILLANVLGFKLVESYLKNEPIQKIKAIQLAILVLLPILVSVVWYMNVEDQGEAANVVVVQPNYEPHHEKFSISERTQLNQFIQLSKEKLDDKTDFLVFPETSFRSIRVNDLSENKTIRQLDKLVKSYPNLSLVTGISAYKVFDEKPDLSTIRESKRGNNTIFWESYNAAIQIDQTDEIPLYKKSLFVPGAEIFPYHRFFFFFKPLVDKLGGTVAGNGGQPQRSVFQSPKGATAPVICYESIYGEYCTGYIKKGANAIFVVTNDGWWDNTAGHQQHLAFSRLRAIETRRSIARSANSGISCFINQRGDIINPTNYEEATAIKGTILMNKSITFYTVWGDLIARIAFFVSILFILSAFSKSRMKKV